MYHSSIEDPSDGKQQQINNLCDVVFDLRMQIKLLNLKNDQRNHELETLNNIKSALTNKYEALKRKYNALKAKYNNKYQEIHNNDENTFKYSTLKEEYRSLKRKYDTKCKENSKQRQINELRADQLRRCIAMHDGIQSTFETKTKELNGWKHKYTKLEKKHNALVKTVKNNKKYQNEYKKLLKQRENDKENGNNNINGLETSDDSCTKTENRKDSEIEPAVDNATQAIKAILKLQDMMSDDDKEKKEDRESDTGKKKKKYSVYSVDQDANYKIINTHFDSGITRNGNVSFTELDFDDLQSVRLPEPNSDDELLSGEEQEQSGSLSSSSF